MRCVRTGFPTWRVVVSITTMRRRFRKRDATPERLRLEECNTAGSSISHSALFNQFPGTAQGRIGDLFTAHQAGYLLNVLFTCQGQDSGGDRKSTRLNSSHVAISYAVFCLKKKK